MRKCLREKEERERKDKSRKVNNHHPWIPQQELVVAIPMSAGQSDGHSLALPGLEEAQGTQSPMGSCAGIGVNTHIPPLGWGILLYGYVSYMRTETNLSDLNNFLKML